MRALIQRVTCARVRVGERIAGEIGEGLLALVGVKQGDGTEDAEWISAKLVGLRIFRDEAGKMNRSILETGGRVLLVSQFTLYGDVRKGRRPSFEKAARPEEAVPLLDDLRRRIETAGVGVAAGEFGAMMMVELVNDGPVTLMLDSETRNTSRTSGEERPSANRIALLAPGSPLTDGSLVLASGSPRRRVLLEELGVVFRVIVPDVDEENGLPDDPLAFARAVGERKARAVAAGLEGGLVLAADTIVVLGNRIFGKPSGEDDAVRMLTELAGRTHVVHTAVCVLDVATGRLGSRVVSTSVTFRAAPPEELRRYVATGEPLDRAGAYAIQGVGGLLVEGIEGDYTNVVGLPVGATLDLLASAVRPEKAR
jgi:MAF protein/D-tyrosyl-tRNA(Tyr) deacylase